MRSSERDGNSVYEQPRDKEFEAKERLLMKSFHLTTQAGNSQRADTQGNGLGQKQAEKDAFGAPTTYQINNNNYFDTEDDSKCTK